jgi:trans-aconitate 2-methyltransferase
VSPQTRDWNAASYDRVSTPQATWAEAVLDRLELRGDETVLDAGCGSGRVTKMLLERLPQGRAIGVDASPSMVEKARQAIGDRGEAFVSDLVELVVSEPVDAVFSTATFHWIPDHDALFARLHAALRPGGQLVAQCGGKGNIAAFKAAMDAVASREPYGPHFEGWRGPWNYAGPEETEERLRRAGFTDVRCWLQPAPITLDEPEEFVTTVCLGHHLERLPEELRKPYATDVISERGVPLELDYVRLNIDARAA